MYSAHASSAQIHVQSDGMCSLARVITNAPYAEHLSLCFLVRIVHRAPDEALLAVHVRREVRARRNEVVGADLQGLLPVVAVSLVSAHTHINTDVHGGARSSWVALLVTTSGGNGEEERKKNKIARDRRFARDSRVSPPSR